jgi:dTDP-4-dehydrorhamnose reductase
MGRMVILGATGMLGSAFLSLKKDTRVPIVLSGRSVGLADGDWFQFDALSSISTLDFLHLTDEDLVVNCIGLIKSRIDEKRKETVKDAIEINSLFPHRLGELADRQGFKVLQIATDCVYSGQFGNYDEESSHDALDVYGKTKSLGEVRSDNFMNLRVSIIGPELNNHTSLFDWVKGQPHGATVTGFQDHIWNGISTHNFARIALGIKSNELFKPGTHHLVPANKVSKYELIQMIAERLGRDDVRIERGESGHRIDRSLATLNEKLNQELWSAAGFTFIPSVEQIVAEMPIVASNDLNN